MASSSLQVMPACIIVTSGTAVANLLPGVVEASRARVPLLVISADRPGELHDVDANQTIPQPRIFQPFVAWEKDFAAPTAEYPLEALLTDVDHAVLRTGATGGTGYGAPVHLNLQFRENLAPDAGPPRGAPHLAPAAADFVGWQRQALVKSPGVARWRAAAGPFTVYAPAPRAPPAAPGPGLPAPLVEALSPAQGPAALVVGELRTAAESRAVAWLAEALRLPVLADVCASLPGRRYSADQLLNCRWARAALRGVRGVLRLGGPIVSARLDAWVKEAAAQRSGPHVRVDSRWGAAGGARSDPAHLATAYVCMGLPELAQAVCGHLLGAPAGPAALGPPSEQQRALCSFVDRLGRAVARAQTEELQALEELTEPCIAQQVSPASGAGGRGGSSAPSAPQSNTPRPPPRDHTGGDAAVREPVLSGWVRRENQVGVPKIDLQFRAS